MQHHMNSPTTSTSCNSAHVLAAAEAAASLVSYRGARKRRCGKWVAEIREPRKRSRIWLGSYFSAEAAARAFDVASYCLRGSSARMNLPALLPQAVKNLPTLSDPKSVQKVALAVGSMVDSVARRTSAPSTSSGSTPPSLVALNSNVPPLASTVISSSTSTSVTIRRRGDHFTSKRPPRLSIAAARNSMAHETPDVDSYSGALSSCVSSSIIPFGNESITESLGRRMLDMGDNKQTPTDHVARLDWLEGAKPEFSPKPTIEQIADAMLILPPFPLHAIAEQRCDDDAGVDAPQVSDSSLWHFW